ncbi:type IV pilus assembly protein FimV [Planktotalea sp.]|uniref:type IV pilus assembly protein FimV n=1 Tax=Planktotalea sp. TaxID=2029877 RepID=UPI003F6CB72E
MFARAVFSGVIFLTATVAKAEEPYVVLQYNSDLMFTAYHDEAGQRTHDIAYGETIYGIVMHYYGAHSEIERLIDQTVQINPDVFLNGDANKMSAGRILTLPADVDTGLESADVIFQF